MPRLPHCTPEQLRDELAEIAADRARLDNANVIAPHRAAERREGFDRWERDLREQLTETDEEGP